MEGEQSPINLPRCEGLDVSGEEWEEQVVFGLVVSSSPLSLSVSLYLCLGLSLSLSLTISVFALI